jgi:hypothetical protein
VEEAGNTQGFRVTTTYFLVGQIDSEMDKRQCKLLKWWLRPAKNLNRPEKRVQICKIDIGRSLNSKDELGSAEDLKHWQEGIGEIPNFEVVKGLRSPWDPTDYHEDSQGISQC